MARDTSNLPGGDIKGDDLPQGGVESGDYSQDVEDGHGHRAVQGFSKLHPDWMPRKYNSDGGGIASPQYFGRDMVPSGIDVKEAAADGGTENDETGDPDAGGPDNDGGSDTPGPGKHLNYERLQFDPDTGKARDRYAGGFLPRDGYSRER